MKSSVGEAINSKVKIPFHRMLAYASTDAAGNLLYTTVTTFILYYFTDVFGLSIAAAGTILLAARILDAFDAPIWGFIIDHTHTKWGQSRPYWLWMAFPFAIFFVLMFWSPDLSATGKFWWALITYLLFGISYTGVGTPITSILPNLSNDSDQRIKLNSTRSIGGMIGYFITATFTLSFVSFFGDTPQAGWRNTAIILGVIGFGLLMFAFSDTREINKPKKAVSILSSIKAAKSNWPWFILVLVFIFYWLGNASRTSVVVYYTQYNLGHKEFASILNALVMMQLIGMVAIPFLVKKFRKTYVLMAGMFLAALGQVLIAFTGQSFIGLSLAWSLASIGTGISVTLPFAMLADTVDYGEWKNGIRASGFLTAIGSSFAIKMGSGLGGWAPSIVLARAGYKAGAVQNDQVLSAIRFCISYLPAIFFVIGGLLILLYIKFERQEKGIRTTLLERRGSLNEG
ncbi:MAG: MFS transporter [Lentilactobacillus hilgardii]|jgi:sugar (glycoside-pentoside-hexuronide) transporter|uniref:MFS transporter n=1 Tax=Lentilactobacillus hilgardii TaxID=1588 RepID=A0A6P1E5Z2_LENHI|nr:MFS transporter [Lentilactobacillus hilgardii]RRG12036.1 MAG: MFS transporter [Lactobacillus sp.]EEI70136.1 transporter, major facilitator family protein [Lentilactobacillus hilgardii ATCC 27305]MBZ2201803.1 MFS transporter [Lentilactobacillus hilgardii]MBZ2204720.1 MFS transporter [Lentilactobacillus hilgardii]MCT3391761.1 MFS transporter [Lentilactobacillus hilgardii]